MAIEQLEKAKSQVGKRHRMSHLYAQCGGGGDQDLSGGGGQEARLAGAGGHDRSGATAAKWAVFEIEEPRRRLNAGVRYLISGEIAREELENIFASAWERVRAAFGEG